MTPLMYQLTMRVAAQHARNKRAAKMPLNAATVAAFRKDLLLLMKNTSRIKRDEKLLAKWRKAMLKWYERFQELGANIRKHLEGRIRENQHKPEFEQKVNLEWAQYYLDHMKPFWDFVWEIRSIPELGNTVGESIEEQKRKMLELPYAKSEGWDREYIDNYFEGAIARGAVVTPEMVAEKAWGKWEEEARKWSNRIKVRARAAWKYLNDLATWTERGGLWGGGEEAIQLLEPTVENLTLEGFNLRFVGFPEAGDWLQAYLPTFKAGLKVFRSRATKVFPWMIRHMLPLEIQWSGKSLNSRDAAATYEGNHITVTLWGASAEPKRVCHVLAHEMGHHVFQTLLSSRQRKDWSAFIKGDYTDLDLRSVLSRMRSGESTSDFANRIKSDDPLLHLQLEATIHHPSTRHWTLYSAGSIQEHLDEGRPDVIRVPANPITGYANKNPEEAFCEALGKLVTYGPRTLPDLINWWMRQMLPNIRMGALARPSSSRVAARYAATTPLPNFSGREPGLLTKAEYLEQQNPGGKFHPSESYDWSLAQMNRDYAQQVGTTSGYGGDYTIEKRRKGHTIRDEDGRLVGVLHRGTLYYSNPSLASKLPASYWDLTKQEPHDLGVAKRKQVKYLSEVLPLVSDTIATNLADYPVVLQNIKVRGEPFTVRAASNPKPDEGTTLAILNSEGQVVAQASNEWGATLLVVAKEYRGTGLGGILGRFWYKLNPRFTSGGYSAAGEANAVRMWEERVREFLSRGWYTQLLRDGTLDNRRIDSILQDLSGRRPGRNKWVPEVPAKPSPKKVLIFVDYPTFVVYDARFLDDPQAEDAEDYIYGYGFLRDSPQVGTFFYTIDYDRPYQELVTLAGLQMARDADEPLYVGKGYGDLVEWDGLPVEQEGDYIELTRDALPLSQLGMKERLVRRKMDPYGEAYHLLLEKAESKWR